MEYTGPAQIFWWLVVIAVIAALVIVPLSFSKAKAKLIEQRKAEYDQALAGTDK